jgi:hypothetical protein
MHQPTLAVLGIFVNPLPTNGAFCLILANVIIELGLLCASFVNVPLQSLSMSARLYATAGNSRDKYQKPPFLKLCIFAPSSLRSQLLLVYRNPSLNL